MKGWRGGYANHAIRRERRTQWRGAID